MIFSIYQLSYNFVGSIAKHTELDILPVSMLRRYKEKI